MSRWKHAFKPVFAGFFVGGVVGLIYKLPLALASGLRINWFRL